jgi:hypothetical protein
MEKVKVLVSFIDIHTNEVHPVGEVFEATEERIAEIQSVSSKLIEVVSGEEAPAKKARKKAGDKQ